MESLRDKLRSLGVQFGANNLPKPEKPTQKYPIEAVVQGFDLHTPLGSAFIVEKDFPKDFLHGNTILSAFPDYQILAQWAKFDILDKESIQDVVFIDAETSGLSGGTGTFAFMIGLGYFTATGFKLIQLFLRNPGLEPAFIIALDQYLSQFKGIVSYNGKSFDIPLIKTRYILNGEKSPFDQMNHIDLLHLARKIWRNRLSSRTLGNLETEILQLARTQEEVPGWMIPDLYFEYLKTGDSRPLAGVFYHNEIDILSLAALFNMLAEMLINPTEKNVPHSLDLIAIARLYEELGYREKALSYYKHSIDLGLPIDFLVDTLKRYALIHKRQNEWREAVKLWEQASFYQDIESCIEIAKYYEHKKKNYPTALIWTDLAEKWINEQEITRNRCKINPEEIDKRKKRILTKLQKHSQKGSPTNHVN